MYMSYTEKKESIKNDLYKQIETYKRGTKKQKKTSVKIEELANTITCFQCLDTKQAWYFRQMDHRVDGNGDFYIMSCAICPDPLVRDKWLENSRICDLYGSSGIKLFRKDDHSGEQRFIALEKRVFDIYPELDQEEPIYKKTESDHISVKKDTFHLKVEIGNIINKTQKIFRAYCGDIPAVLSLLSNIELNISDCENTSSQEKIICEEIDKDKFMYIKLKNNSSTMKKKVLGLCEVNKYKLDIDIRFYLLKPDNESAHKQCNDIVNKAAMNDISELSEIFLSIGHEVLK